MPDPGLGWSYEKIAGPMRRAAVGQPCPCRGCKKHPGRGCGVIMTSGRGARAASVDHWIARALGGSHSPENLHVVCVSCNSSRGARVRTAKSRKARPRPQLRRFAPVPSSRSL